MRDEHNARLHAAATVAVIAVGAWLRLPISEWRWIALATALVWMAEAFNTAIEDLCDRICPDFDPAIGCIKDLAAAGVLLASIAAALIGAMTLGPPVLARFA